MWILSLVFGHYKQYSSLTILLSEIPGLSFPKFPSSFWICLQKHKSLVYNKKYIVLGSSPSRIQGNPQDEQRQRMRERVRQSSGLGLKFIFARPLYTLNNIFLGEVHIAYTQVISKHYSNLTFNRNRMYPHTFIHKSLSYHLAFRPANILWLAPDVT